MKVTLTVTVGSNTLSADLPPALCEQITAHVKGSSVARGVLSTLIDAIDHGTVECPDCKQTMERDEMGLLSCPTCTELPADEYNMMHAIREAIG